MKPFHLILEPGTPFVIPNDAIQLDALLYYCVGSRWDISEPTAVIERMKDYLEFDEVLGVFKASAMTMLVTPDEGVSLGSIQRADDLRNKLTREIFAAKNKSIVLAGGPTKKRLTQRQNYFSPYVHFQGVGDGEAIRQLLMQHLPGIGTDARTASSGEIVSARVIPGDFSYTDNGKALRRLPLNYGQQFGLKNPEPVGLVPPYYHKEQVQGFAPDRIIVKALSHYFS